MKSKPLVSILTPVYNVERYIKKCIHSVLNQTYRNWEWIIIDDGSTDNTPKIIKSFDDPRIIYIRQKRKGVEKIVETFNIAFKKSTGDLIALLAGDDYWPRYKLDLQVKIFREDCDVILCYGDVCIINVFDERISRRKPKAPKKMLYNNPIGSSLKMFFLLKNFIPAPTLIIRRDILEKIGGFVQVDGLPAEDFPTLIRLSLEGKFYYIPKILAFYRKHPLSISFGKSLEFAKTSSKFILDFLKEYNERLSSLNIHFNDIIIKKLHEKIIRELAARYDFVVGLSYLINKEYDKARRYFINQLKNYKNRYTILSILGIFATYLKLTPRVPVCVV